MQNRLVEVSLDFIAKQQIPSTDIWIKLYTVIKDIVGKPPVGWYYGMVQGKGGAKARGLVARAFHEEKIPLKYYSDAYNDDLPYWIPSPLENQDEGLLIIPYG